MLSLIFPYLDGQLTLTEGNQEPARREEYSRDVVGFGGRFIPQKIEPGGSLDFPIFFQTYYASPLPGLHEFHYNMPVPCQVQGTTPPVASGGFSVRIEPPNPEQLKQIVAEYSTQLANGDPAASEGLLSMDTSLVIPQLRKIVEGSRFERALQSLSRFKGNPAAEQIIMQSVRSKEPARQIAALGVFSRWKKEIEPSDVNIIVSSPSRDVRLEALRYFRALNSSKNLPLVESLLSDSDETVADEARRTHALLKGKVH